MFPAGYVPDGKGAERCCAKVSGDRFADLVDPRGINADVQEAGHRCGPGLHDTGFEVAGGAGDADPLHMGEQAQRGRFVGYAVLQADNRRLGGGDLGELGERSTGLLALHRQEYDVVGAPVDLPRMAHRRNANRI